MGERKKMGSDFKSLLDVEKSSATEEFNWRGFVIGI